MSGHNTPHSMNGCSTCRRRKVKCGEEHTVCHRYVNFCLGCEWGVPAKDGRSAQVRRLQQAPSAADQCLWPAHEMDVVDAVNIAEIPPGALPTVLSPKSWPRDTVLQEPSQVTSFYPPIAPARIATPLYLPLSTNKIACANSLTLTEDDQKYFHYFPSSSIVYYYMKGWHWSTFCYLYQVPAATNKIIMRMILAVSASDMHRHGLVVPSSGRPTAEDHGRYHYSLAVKEFRQSLETSQRQVSVEELEIVFAIMFLMIIYEWQFGNSVCNLQLHLRGVRSLLESHPQLFRLKDINGVFLSPEDADGNLSQEDGNSSKVSFIPEQLLLWILYIDASCRPMGLTDSLYDYVRQSNNTALNPEHLYRCARLWGLCFWGKRYPDQEMLDDIENYRALELLHASFDMRFRTWRVLVDSGPGTESVKSLFRDIITTRDKYSDLFITAKFAGTVSARRTLSTIYLAVCTFYTQILLHRRLLCVGSLPSAIHRQALAGITNIAKKQFASDPRLLRRLHWPLLMAIIETDDADHRFWIRQRLLELRDTHLEYLWANEVADTILAQQDVSQGVCVNLAEMLLQRFHLQ